MPLVITAMVETVSVLLLNCQKVTTADKTLPYVPTVKPNFFFFFFHPFSLATRSRNAESQQRQQVPYGVPGGSISPSASSSSLRGRTDSGASDPRRTAGPTHRSHSPSQSMSHSFGGHVASSSRTTSDKSASASKEAAIGRSASPAASDRTPTPTQGHSGSGRSTPTTSGSGTASSIGNGHAYSPSSSTLSVAGQQIQRKASPLSQGSASVRSMTPTQSNTVANGKESSKTSNGVQDEESDGNESDETASDRRDAKGHKTTNSNASSATSEHVNAQSSKGHTPSNSIFKNKLRKALSLSELNNENNDGHPNSSSSSLSNNSGLSSPYSSSSSATSNPPHHQKNSSLPSQQNKMGRSSLTSNSSSSDTSHSSTLEPRTPPNGASPILPNAYASASASNLHSSLGGRDRQGSNGTTASGSLPSHTGRRFGILNSKMNSSTDNISISSTVSSASMMLRKMGNLGKLARKSSVKSLSNIFHRGEKSTSSDSLRSDAVSEFGVPGTLSAPKDRRKGGTATPHVAYVTAELESGTSASSGMTPAAALVRKHQEKERLQLEAEKKAAAALAAAQRKSAIPMSPTTTGDSPRSRMLEKEKEKLKNNKKNGGKKFGGLFGNKKDKEGSIVTTSSPTSEQQQQQQQQQLEASPSPVGSSNRSASPVVEITNSTLPPQIPDIRPSLDGITFDSWRKAGPTKLRAGDPYDEDFDQQNGLLDDDDDGDDDDEGFDDQTPRQSIEILGDAQQQQQQQYQQYSQHGGQSSVFEDDTASYRVVGPAESDTTIHSFGPASHTADPEEYDDGGHDGRSGQAIPERPPRNARPAKGILKSALRSACPVLASSGRVYADFQLACDV